jgi:hypothetical protein
VTLVALFGPILVMAEGWLDARLPHARDDDRRVIGGYTVANPGRSLLGLMAVVPPYLGPETYVLLASLSWSSASQHSRAGGSRVIGRPLPGWVSPVARLAIACAVIAGSAVAAS